MSKLYASIALLFCVLTFYTQKSNAQEKPPISSNQTSKIETSFEADTKDPYFNYTAVNKVIHPSYARTGKASLLLHSKNSYSIIHSKLIPLRKNSEVSLKVQALYPQKGNFITKAIAVAGASALAFQANKYLTPIVQSENNKAINKKLYPTFGFGLALAPELLKGRTKEVPKAYLRCLLYDKDTNLIDSQIKLLDKTAKNNWQEIALNTKAPKDGYLQVTFVNESKKDVLLDDISIIITKDNKQEKEEEIIIAPVQSLETARLFSGSIANTTNVQSNGECSVDGGELDTVVVLPCTDDEKCDFGNDRCFDPLANCDGDGEEEEDPCFENPFQCDCDPFYCGDGPGGGGGSGGGGTGGGTGGGGGDGSGDNPNPNPNPKPDNPRVKNMVVDPCLRNLVNAVVDENLTNSISKKINANFGTTSGKGRLSFIQNDNLNNPRTHQPAGGGTSFNWDNGTNEIEINSLFLYGSSQEYQTAVLLHESLHAYFNYMDPSSNPNKERIHHTNIFNNYIDDIRNALMEIYPAMDITDATALALEGLDDITRDNNGNPIKSYDDAAKEKYGMSLNEAKSKYNKYFMGEKGTPCPQ